MAKDILVNTQSGDLTISESTPQTAYWNVVWGKLFFNDTAEYMNIVVPRGYINQIHFDGNQCECLVNAKYHPVNTTFIVRLVVYGVNVNDYELLKDYAPNTPDEAGAVYYPTYTGKAQDILACQLPIVDADGNFRVIFKRYANSNYFRAIIVSAKNVDFAIGESDSQSAQLLAQCAPGKYYRYPTTGVDLTKYINSVVEHTDMASQLVKQFTADSKQILEAEFDSSTGDLQIVFSGTEEADDKNLTPPDKLDVDLFRVADDDYVRAIYDEVHKMADDNNGFIADLSASSCFMGLCDVGNAALLDEEWPTVTSGWINADGSVITEPPYYIGETTLKAGRLYAINYPKEVVETVNHKPSYTSSYQHPSLFAIYDGDKAVYVDEPFYTDNSDERDLYLESFENRRCFIPLIDLTVKFYAGKSYTWIYSQQWGIYPITDKDGNYDSILGLADHPETGHLMGIITHNSIIRDIKIDGKTNQILIIK